MKSYLASVLLGASLLVASVAAPALASKDQGACPVPPAACCTVPNKAACCASGCAGDKTAACCAPNEKGEKPACCAPAAACCADKGK